MSQLWRVRPIEKFFLEIGFVLIAASLLGFIAKLLRQPLIIAYIAAGILLGPFAFKVIGEKEFIETLSNLGVTFLLFMVGLELDFRKIREVGKVAFLTGVGQIIFAVAAGISLSMLLGFSLISSAYIAIALAFSSTIIVIKLLSEKNDVNSLNGRILVGFLLVQDFVALLLLIFLNGTNAESEVLYLSLISTLAKGVFLICTVMILSRTLLPKLFGYIARSPELLFLASLSWCFIFAISSALVGLSVEIGAFVAGVSLAALPYTPQVVAKIKPLRDFFITIFFVSLGLHTVFTGGKEIVFPVIILSLLVVVGNPIIMLVIMGAMGFRRRVSFLTSVAIAQVSEFSLILAALGMKLGHIDQKVVSVITFVGIITITVSSYMILHADSLYLRFRQHLRLFERKKKAYMEIPEKMKDHWILFGYHRMGYHFLKTLRHRKKEVVVVDFNPQVIKHLDSQGVIAVYGDISDPEILETAHFETSNAIISSIGNVEISKVLLRHLQRYKKQLKIILTADQLGDALELYKLGADYVIVPHLLGALALDDLIDETLASGSKQSIQSLKTEQVKLISQQMKDLGSQALSTRN